MLLRVRDGRCPGPPGQGMHLSVLRHKILDNDALFPHTIKHLNCKRRIAPFSRQRPGIVPKPEPWRFSGLTFQSM